MIQINSMSTLATASIQNEIKEYLTDYINSVLSTNNTNDLTKCGFIYFLETYQDTQNFNDVGLRQPLKDTPFEYCEIITLKISHGETKLLHGCYIFNNDFAIDVFADESIFDSETRQTLLDNTIK